MTDYQAYRLGLSLSILDTIRSIREKGIYFTSLDGFRHAVNLPDSVIERLGPQLRFPASELKPRSIKTSNRPVGDLNKASAEELRAIPGIGQVLSARILKFRSALGGFIQNEQVYDVYGLDSAVVRRLLKRYVVKDPPEIKRIPINTASVEELAANVYISWDLAREIVLFRERRGSIESWKELEGLEHLQGSRIARIRLYLSLEKKVLE